MAFPSSNLICACIYNTTTQHVLHLVCCCVLYNICTVKVQFKKVLTKVCTARLLSMSQYLTRCILSQDILNFHNDMMQLSVKPGAVFNTDKTVSQRSSRSKFYHFIMSSNLLKSEMNGLIHVHFHITGHYSAAKTMTKCWSWYIMQSND